MGSPPTATEILEQVDRVLADARFVRSPILSRLLRFSVDETLAGRGDRLKEYVLGVEVCGRPATYDPRMDPIVRVQTRELRRRLHEYYETAGRHDRVVIELPKGHYVATFDSGDGAQYNNENCQAARDLFQQQPGVRAPDSSSRPDAARRAARTR